MGSGRCGPGRWRGEGPRWLKGRLRGAGGGGAGCGGGGGWGGQAPRRRLSEAETAQHLGSRTRRPGCGRWGRCSDGRVQRENEPETRKQQKTGSHRPWRTGAPPGEGDAGPPIGPELAVVFASRSAAGCRGPAGVSEGPGPGVWDPGPRGLGTELWPRGPPGGGTPGAPHGPQGQALPCGSAGPWDGGRRPMPATSLLSSQQGGGSSPAPARCAPRPPRTPSSEAPCRCPPRTAVSGTPP